MWYVFLVFFSLYNKADKTISKVQVWVSSLKQQCGANIDVIVGFCDCDFVEEYFEICTIKSIISFCQWFVVWLGMAGKNCASLDYLFFVMYYHQSSFAFFFVSPFTILEEIKIQHSTFTILLKKFAPQFQVLSKNCK